LINWCSNESTCWTLISPVLNSARSWIGLENNVRFVVERRGEPAVVIMSVQDFIRTASPPPDWLEKAWGGAKRRGLDKLSSQEIDAEISAHRREKRK
jgi:hypothetical protein